MLAIRTHKPFLFLNPMDSLRHFPLGTPFPPSPHAVASSLPTLADVRGYEEKDPRVMAALQSGYPRFLQHRFVRELTSVYLERLGLDRRYAVLVPGRRTVQDMLDRLGSGFASERVETHLFLVYCDAGDAPRAEALHKYVQHVGCGVSSREAEDWLVRYGRLAGCHPEPPFEGHAETAALKDLAEVIGCRPADLLLCASGMNAFFAAFRAIQEFQQSRGRTRWLQLGWLYLDSGIILQEFLESGERLDYCYAVDDAEAVLAAVASLGHDLSCVVVECPTNPLAQVADLPRIAEAVRKVGGVLLVDPTIASIYNVNVLPYADIAVTSLTKYACHEGDVMSGALAVNRASPYYGDLVLRTSRYHVPPYWRDLQRLAGQLPEAPGRVRRMNANAEHLRSFLVGQPAVRRVHYAGTAPRYETVRRPKMGGGCVLTIEIEGSMEAVYDALRTVKGPSFGTVFTLLSPFMYLAHYDLVMEAEGRRFLASVGLDPELIRVSVGTEPGEALEAVFAEALARA